jgi:DNA helicase-2/ATP-dependent DNA helicase PcrA
MTAFGSSYGTPGWQRAQANRGRGGFDETGQARYVREDDEHSGIDEATDAATTSPPPLRGRDREGGNFSRGRAGKRRTPLTIEGELVAKSTGTASAFSPGDRVFHIKFGNGNVTAVDGNKLTIQFDKAGEKRVVDSFVERV